MNNHLFSNRNTECTEDISCPRNKNGDGRVQEIKCREIIIHRDQSWLTLPIILITPSPQLRFIPYGDNLAINKLEPKCGVNLAILHGNQQIIGIGILIQG